MKISGFTIVRNAIKYNYPVMASILSILPVCDEFIVNVGDSQDGTLDLVRSIKSPKIRIIETQWNMAQGSTVLSEQTNVALGHCAGDWAFYLQSDEVIHEADLPRLKGCMQRYLNEPGIDALRFKWLHFYGSYWRYRVDYGWYQKQDRIIRNNGTIESCGDAFGFRRKDGGALRRRDTGCFVYHYGWVQPEDVMAERRHNAEAIGFISLKENEKLKIYDYGNLNRFPVYFGSHPSVMNGLVQTHALSQKDWQDIAGKFWWHPARWLRLRYKTGTRVKHKHF